MANVRLLRQADSDLEEAVAWYESHSRQAAARFQQEVASALARIAALPELYALSDERHRLCPIRKSQYILVYRFEQDKDEVVVVAVAHAKRDPQKWQSGV
jgi:plasmid stabilization system protein ParE